jgi:hypothetical protein
MHAVASTNALRVAPVVAGARAGKASPFALGASSVARRGSKPAAAAPKGLFAAPAVASLEKTSEKKSEKTSLEAGRLALLATVASNPVLFGAQEAFAKGGEFGILEGRTAALVHPAFLGILWFASLYAGYTGLQWRRVRTIKEEIDGIKASVLVKEMVTASGETETAAPALPADAQAKVEELTATRKELVAGGFKDKHNNVGSLILAFGVTLAVEGGMNTYMRVGKLFPGPHLYAGMGIVCIWAMAAGLVPEMQRGNQKARDLHIALNCINLGLFTWQIPTGLEIVGKVFQFTSWP